MAAHWETQYSTAAIDTLAVTQCTNTEVAIVEFAWAVKHASVFLRMYMLVSPHSWLTELMQSAPYTGLQHKQWTSE